MEKINEKRREVAKREKIPNMKELVWSDDLAREVSVANDTVRNERYFDWLIDSIYEEHFDLILQETSQIRRNHTPDLPVYTSQYYFPLAEKIGCNERLVQNDSYTFCFVSPGIPDEHFQNPRALVNESYYFKMEHLFLQTGKAGSKCEYGYEDNDGLCKFIEPTTTTKKPTPNEPSSSSSIFSLVPILMVLGFGYSIFT
ncbi:unnamed protein product [Caenorhabditis nigoni]